MRARARGFDRFVDVHAATPEQVAERIRSDGIDLLVDLKGHTAGAPPRVLALRPAPIQAHYLGYPGTLGGGLVDYLIGDATVTPAAHADDYAEALVRLPGSYQVNDRQRPIAEAPSRAALGLPADGVVLCNFNATWKLRPEAFDAWATILRRVPQAVLWLLARRDDDPAVANLRRKSRCAASIPYDWYSPRRGPTPSTWGCTRMPTCSSIPGRTTRTPPAATLWAGAVITMPGETFASRVGESLSLAVGLPEPRRSRRRRLRRAGGFACARSRCADAIAPPPRGSRPPEQSVRHRAHDACACPAYLAMADQHRQGVRKPIDVR